MNFKLFNDISLTLPSALAHRSHTAFRTAALASWITPFSGPNWYTQWCEKYTFYYSNHKVTRKRLVDYVCVVVLTHLSWLSLVRRR